MISELAEYAAVEFELSKVNEDGSTERDYLTTAYEHDGIKRGLLAKELPLPWQVEHVWCYFMDLHSERGSNGFGPNRISSTLLKDWCDLNRIRLELWEINAIKKLDRMWLETLNKKA